MELRKAKKKYNIRGEIEKVLNTEGEVFRVDEIFEITGIHPSHLKYHCPVLVEKNPKKYGVYLLGRNKVFGTLANIKKLEEMDK